MMLKYTFSIIISIILFSSCKKDVKNQLNTVYQSTIILNLERMDSWMPNEDIEVSKQHPYLTYVVYSDSTTCTKCSIKSLNLWNELVQIEDSTNGMFQITFIIDPPQTENINELLQSNFFLNHKVYIDDKHLFQKNNINIANEQLFHSILIDNNNKVCLVGDPIKNKKIKQLFNKIMQNVLTKSIIKD